ncbi:Carboxypeptidase regulatory-like domain-containing protein [Granulicella rosea]|uniref:Carboxypeptidase regulatory-like domain-containing protein n=1 Tax=Granulicella rosea TaxID=474952 RepID=A0A239EEY6_9BACT|nr:TonB-dependent receptor [Granulicella rosea]SNS43215.1 Carboxypeptidase regulatory-like domain-containing protein [Granulicella rosea]
MDLFLQAIKDGSSLFQTKPQAKSQAKRSSFISRATRLLLLVALAVSFAARAFAQVESADILGKVADSTKAVIQGAAVTATNIDTGVSRTAKTNPAGEFTFNALPIGRYSVTIVSTGFETYSVPEIALSQGDRTRVDATMTIGAAEIVDVGAVAPDMQTDSSVVGTTITDRQVEDLPLNGRNFMELAQQVAGANEGPPNALSSGNRPDDRRLTSSVSVNGQDENVNNQLIDGLDNNERIIGTIGVRPSVDAIAEFRLQTNLYTAEVGRTAGAVINIITKAGTNSVHGSVYEFFRNDIFDATDYFALTHTELRQNQYGASIGGPVLRDKVFFFADYEGFRKVYGRTNTSTVPTLFEEQNPGNFSDIGHTSVPAANIDPIGLAYFKLYPAPNRVPATANGANFTYSPNVVQITQTGDARLDYALPKGDRIFVRYTANTADTSSPGTLPIVNGIAPGGNPFAYAGTSAQFAENLQGNYLHLFTANLLLELKAGYTRINNSSFPLNYGKNLSTQFGLSGANIGTADTSALTTMSPAGYSSVGDGIFVPIKNIDNTFQEVAQLTWNHGRQSIKAGGALVRRQALSAQSSYPAGYLQFNTYTGGSSTPAFAGVSCAPLGCLLRGLVYLAQRSNQLIAPGFRTWEPSGYIQDDWRILPKLTLNLGLRYDVFTPLTEAHNRLSNFDPASGQLLVAGVNGVSASAGVKTDYSNVSPRIGFASALRPTTVLRGGFGMTFIPVSSGAKTSLGNAPYVYNYRSQYNSTTLAMGLPVPTVQAPNNLNATAVAGFTLSGIDRNYRSSYIEQFNLTLQQDLHNSTLTLSWVGEIGKHLRLNPNINLAPPGLNSCPVGTTSPSSTCYISSLPFYNEYPTLTTVNEMVSEGYSSYNALQATLSHRFTRSLGLNANYTWAHGLNDTANYALGSASNGVIPRLISTQDYGDSDLNIRNRFAMLLNYSFPFGASAHGLKATLIKGWQSNATLTLSGGQPFSVTDNSAYSNTGVQGGAERALQIGNPEDQRVVPFKNINHWFNNIAPCPVPATATQPANCQYAAFTHQVFGTYVPSRRNSIYGPANRVFNYSTFKTFPLRDRYKLQFRAELFNVSNTPNFAQPDASVGDGAFGTITSTRLGSNPRQIQFALKLLF